MSIHGSIKQLWIAAGEAGASNGHNKVSSRLDGFLRQNLGA